MRPDLRLRGTCAHFSRAVTRSASSNAPSAPTATSADPTAYCANLTRTHDNDAYLTSYFYPNIARPAFFAIHAFNVELEQIPKKVKQDGLLAMRFRWWKDTLKAVTAGDPPHHPVPLALHTALRTHPLQPYHLSRILTAHSAASIPPLSPPSVKELTTFAQSTRSSLLYLSLSILPPLPSSSTPDMDRLMHAASHVGQAVGLVGLLQAAGRGEGPLGRSWQGGEAMWKERVQEVARAAREEVGRARILLGTDERVPREAMPAFLAAIPPQVYLETLERAEFDPRVQKARLKDWRTAWRVWRAWRRSTF